MANLPSEEKLNAILDSTLAGTWEWNLDTDEFQVNDRWCEMLGYTFDELHPCTIETWEQLCHADDLEEAYKCINAYLSDEIDRYDCVIRMRHKSNGWRWIHVRGMMISNQDEDTTGWLLGTHLDVTREHESQLKLQKLSESLPGIIYTFVMEPGGRYYFTYASKKTKDFYGLEPETALEDADRIFNLILSEDIDRVKASIASSFESLSHWECDYRVSVNGETHWIRGVASPELGADGRVTWNGMVVNIDEQKRLEFELERLSITDELTGLFNRRCLLRRLDELVDEYERYGGGFALISLDIDNFKAINDAFGHPVGDQVLQRFATLLDARTRKSDLVARTGGEEFIVLMPNTDRASSLQVAESLRSSIEALTFTSETGEGFQVTLSAGVVSCPDNGTTVRDLLLICDRSLYQAKREGRNRVIISPAPGDQFPESC